MSRKATVGPRRSEQANRDPSQAAEPTRLVGSITSQAAEPTRLVGSITSQAAEPTRLVGSITSQGSPQSWLALLEVELPTRWRSRAHLSCFLARLAPLTVELQYAGGCVSL